MVIRPKDYKVKKNFVALPEATKLAKSMVRVPPPPAILKTFSGTSHDKIFQPLPFS